MLLLSKSVPQISSCPIPGSSCRPGCCQLYRRILWPKGKCPLPAETSSACTWSPSAKQRHTQPSCCLKLEWRGLSPWLWGAIQRPGGADEEAPPWHAAVPMRKVNCTLPSKATKMFTALPSLLPLKMVLHTPLGTTITVIKAVKYY